MAQNAYQQAADRLIASLEAGTIPWRKPWVSAGIPRNLVSKKEYRGMNVIFLAMTGYASPYWLTLKQANGLGSSVKKGEHGTQILFMSAYNKKTKNEKGDEESNRYRFWKSYHVFNLTQCEPELAEKLGLNKPVAPIEDLPAAQAVWDNYPNRPEFQDSDHAWYRPSEDKIGMPVRGAFKKQCEYYSTLFHEMIHSTGALKRLSRDGITHGDGFGNKVYSAEELVAEFGASMLCGVVGIQPAVVDNSASYIKHWLEVLKASDNKNVLMKSISAAQKACDYIRATTFEAPAEPLKEAVCG